MSKFIVYKGGISKEITIRDLTPGENANINPAGCYESDHMNIIFRDDSGNQFAMDISGSEDDPFMVYVNGIFQFISINANFDPMAQKISILVTDMNTGSGNFKIQAKGNALADWKDLATYTGQPTKGSFSLPDYTIDPAVLLTGDTYEIRVLDTTTGVPSAGAYVSITAGPSLVLALAYDSVYDNFNLTGSSENEGSGNAKLQFSTDGTTWNDVLSSSPYFPVSSTVAQAIGTAITRGATASYRLVDEDNGSLVSNVVSLLVPVVAGTSAPVLAIAETSDGKLDLTGSTFPGTDDYDLSYSSDGGASWNHLADHVQSLIQPRLVNEAGLPTGVGLQFRLQDHLHLLVISNIVTLSLNGVQVLPVLAIAETAAGRFDLTGSSYIDKVGLYYSSGGPNNMTLLSPNVDLTKLLDEASYLPLNVPLYFELVAVADSSKKSNVVELTLHGVPAVSIPAAPSLAIAFNTNIRKLDLTGSTYSGIADLYYSADGSNWTLQKDGIDLTNYPNSMVDINNGMPTGALQIKLQDHSDSTIVSNIVSLTIPAPLALVVAYSSEKNELDFAGSTDGGLGLISAQYQDPSDSTWHAFASFSGINSVDTRRSAPGIATPGVAINYRLLANINSSTSNVVAVTI